MKKNFYTSCAFFLGTFMACKKSSTMPATTNTTPTTINTAPTTTKTVRQLLESGMWKNTAEIATVGPTQFTGSNGTTLTFTSDSTYQTGLILNPSYINSTKLYWELGNNDKTLALLVGVGPTYSSYKQYTYSIDIINETTLKYYDGTATYVYSH